MYVIFYFYITSITHYVQIIRNRYIHVHNTYEGIWKINFIYRISNLQDRI